ncbi:MAG: DUF1801 domain-containing protein [Methanomassiliicoccales archaeon]|jgi:uncharacterized protein YdhG (YjbR/CyaY superfamily)
MDKRSMKDYENIDEYIAQFPEEVRAILEKIRKIIRDLAPDATEAISYGIPTFKLNGNLIHFAAYEHHIGFYPGADAMEMFSKDLSKYKRSKGTVQFPIDGPIPYEVIETIVKHKVEESHKKKKK